MKLKFLYFLQLLIVFTFISACNSASIRNNSLSANSVDTKNILYIYEDGKMKFRSRYLNEEDVIIYKDAKGGEKAAIKVRVPRHADFYHGSVIVVRIDNEMEKSVSQK